MGPQCFEFSLFSSIEVLICRPIFHWSPLSWQQAPEIGFLHSFSSNCATCTFTFQQGTRVGGPPRAKARVGQVIAVQFRWTIEHQSLSDHLLVVHFTQFFCRNSTVLYFGNLKLTHFFCLIYPLIIVYILSVKCKNIIICATTQWA